MSFDAWLCYLCTLLTGCSLEYPFEDKSYSLIVEDGPSGPMVGEDGYPLPPNGKVTHDPESVSTITICTGRHWELENFLINIHGSEYSFTPPSEMKSTYRDLASGLIPVSPYAESTSSPIGLSRYYAQREMVPGYTVYEYASIMKSGPACRVIHHHFVFVRMGDSITHPLSLSSICLFSDNRGFIYWDDPVAAMAQEKLFFRDMISRGSYIGRVSAVFPFCRDPATGRVRAMTSNDSYTISLYD